MTSPEAKATAALLTRFSGWEVEHTDSEHSCLSHAPSGFKVIFFQNGDSYKWSRITVEREGARFQVPKQDTEEVHVEYWLPHAREATARKEESAKRESAALLNFCQTYLSPQTPSQP